MTCTVVQWHNFFLHFSGGGGGFYPFFLAPPPPKKKCWVNFYRHKVGVSFYRPTSLTSKREKKKGTKTSPGGGGGCWNPPNTPCIGACYQTFHEFSPVHHERMIEGLFFLLFLQPEFQATQLQIVSGLHYFTQSAMYGSDCILKGNTTFNGSWFSKPMQNIF